MAKYFEFGKHGTSYRKEIIAGITTFLAMAYILAVNPGMLSAAGMELEAVFTATAIAAVIGTLVMGVLAKYPIALAPGMGLNAFFTFSVVIGFGIPFDQALSGVLVSGIIFLILALTGIREAIINAIPSGLKHAAAAGIGLFIALIGLKNAGIVAANPDTLVGLGTFTEGTTLLGIFGIIVTALLMVRKLNGAIFYGILVTAIVGMIFGLVETPSGFIQAPPNPDYLGDAIGPIFDFDSGFWTGQMWIVIFTFLFVDFFDTAGTLVGVATQAGFIKDDKLPRAGRALASDSVATIAGALVGTSTTTSYVESTAGVAAGGRTGFTAVVTAICFALSLFLFPVVEVIANVGAVTAPALVMVGVLMASNLAKIEWEKLEEAVPAFLTAVMMPLTYSIATGIALGFIVYPLTKIVKGEGHKVHWIMYFLFFVFLAYFIFVRE
ncbi:NCS2 family permease [Marinicrinis lubricantis]|uniref:NCS2 family permease n=1 Tax=Marinicrinis lubricantis TaxID=2086470 RepID=UPI0039EF5836